MNMIKNLLTYKHIMNKIQIKLKNKIPIQIKCPNVTNNIDETGRLYTCAESNN